MLCAGPPLRVWEQVKYTEILETSYAEWGLPARQVVDPLKELGFIGLRVFVCRTLGIQVCD